MNAPVCEHQAYNGVLRSDPVVYQDFAIDLLTAELPRAAMTS